MIVWEPSVALSRLALALLGSVVVLTAGVPLYANPRSSGNSSSDASS